MSDGHRSLEEDQRFFIDQICRIILEEDIDLLMIAGDIYDRSNPAAWAAHLYDYAMTRICQEMGTPVVLIAGNHDGVEFLSNCEGLLRNSGLFICARMEEELAVYENDEVQIFMLPWFNSDRIRSIYPDRAGNIRNLEDAVSEVTRLCRSRFSEGKRHIALAHAFVTGASTSTSDRAAEIGFASQVGSEVYDGFDYVALGHLHGPQDVTGTIRYSGTPMPYSFGAEEDQEKSVTIIDTDDMSRRIIPVPLLHKRTTISGTLDEVLNYDCDEETRNGYVRLDISDSPATLSVQSSLRSVYPNALVINGMSYEAENSRITLSSDELGRIASDPSEIFKFFCRDVMEMEPDERLTGLFARAVEEAKIGEDKT